MHCRCLLLEFWDILEQEITQTQTSVWWVTEPFKETSFHFVICLAFFSIQSFKKAVIGKPLSESQGILNSPPLPPPPFPTLTNWMYQSIGSFEISPSSSTIPPSSSCNPLGHLKFEDWLVNPFNSHEWDKTIFLLTISIQYQADKWQE